MSKKNKVAIPTWLLVLLIAAFIVLIVIIFLFSFGKIDLGVKGNVQEFRDSKEEAKLRHKRLKTQLDKQLALKEKLTKRFNRVYFLIRLFFVLTWIGSLIVLGFLGIVKDLSDALSYSEAAIIVLVALNFITFGSISNLNKFIEAIRIRLENWIWGKHIKLDEKIEKNKNELVRLEGEISN